ncbi:unnamed protein product [Paramecium pentaurelia]|uniref:Protein kinase domain-containing protein n=1 Tax=Paramecium pentaurelia TaxID=43138 RepID=A0A8S1SVQ8_9CILI|nr:unnamed protein product [Paramecium pentaurelia]
MKAINYDQTILTVSCYRKHMIIDTKYYAQVLPNQLILSSSPRQTNPKYILEFSVEKQIHWVTKNKTSILEQFGFSYQGKIKYFYGQSIELYKLKDCIQGQIMYKEISDFYKPQNLLGKGGSAKVYMVTKKGYNEKYASKCVDKRYLQEDGGYDALFNEIKIMQKLKHENIIQLVDLYEGESTFYLILEYLAGESLNEFFNRRQTTLEQNQIQIIMKQLLQAVSNMHLNGIMHRDLKPENIMFKQLNQFDSLKIVDFGLATFSNAEEYPFPNCGTPGYVAPEVANLRDLKQKYDVICDEFSVGCIFYKLCTNKDLFPGKEYKEILKQNKKCHLNLDSLAIYKTPPEACDLIQKLLTINPKERITASEALNHPYFSQKYETKKQKFQSSNINKQNPVFQTQNFQPISKLTNIDDDEVEDENCNQLQVPVMNDLKSFGLIANSNLEKNKSQLIQNGRRNFKKCQTQEFEQHQNGLKHQMNNFKPSFILKNDMNEQQQQSKQQQHKHNTLINNFPKIGEQEGMSKIDEDIEENGYQI